MKYNALCLLVSLIYVVDSKNTSILSPLAVKKPSLSLSEGFQCGNDSDCPPWAACGNQSVCRCLQHLPNKIDCSDTTLQLSVLTAYCVTYDNNTGNLHTGLCFENCFNKYKDLYLPLPLDPLQLNQRMCGQHWNREGTHCGKCSHNHAPLVFSYEMKCVPCSEGNRNLWIFFLVAIGPSTVFFFIVVFFKINTTKSHLHGYMLFAQVVSMPSFVRQAWLAERHNRIRMTIVQGFMVFYSIWNLDILKGVYPDICLNVSTLTAMSLEYIVALYPLVLVFFSYILITLHDRNYRVIVYIWRPFRYIFTFFRRNWDVRSTVVDTYASFFQLSFMKIVGISCDLLIPITDYKVNRTGYTWSMVLYYDGSVDFLSREHLQYAIPALIILLFFCLLPTLMLLLYPCRCFQVLLNTLRLRSRILDTVMDSFQGYYKDGTERGTRDCRWFSAVPLLVCYTFIVFHNATQDGTFYPIGSAIAVFVIILICFIQPFKSAYISYQKTEIFYWALISGFYSFVTSHNTSKLRKAKNTTLISIVLLFTVGFLPFVYIICVSIHWIITHARIFGKCRQIVYRVFRGKYEEIETEREDSVSDRSNNSSANENLQGVDRMYANMQSRCNV